MPNTPASAPHNRQPLRVGTRDSKLALVQTELVIAQIKQAHPGLAIETLTMKTIGDKIQDVAMTKFGDKGLFTKELETALAAQHIDIIVHSLKDMPTQLPANMRLLAITQREDPRDAVVMHVTHQGKSISELPPGSIIGTGSVRRVAQLRRLYPWLEFRDVRGNLTTRLAKLDAAESPFAALILAVAGLRRQGLGHRIAHALDDVLHAVGQGALGVEVRSDDSQTIELLADCLNHRESRLRCLAERELMRRLEGGCSVPIGVTTEWLGERRVLRLCAVVAAPDGSAEVRAEGELAVVEESDAEELRLELEDARAHTLGANVAAAMRAKGAGAILDAIQRPEPIAPEIIAAASARSE
ncbi:porphobilinogen deaminase [Coemansia sp. RSA 2703]|nr:porphobilinogen deaminase [Coemansia sp. RSA 2703]KAJ2375887.1 porphobilinogen deaminase [Coemansia sp. RSA 2607]